MEIKKLITVPCLSYHYVIETKEGEFYRFYMIPFREVKPEDLLPMPHYIAKGKNRTEAPGYLYPLYGFTKA